MIRRRILAQPQPQAPPRPHQEIQSRTTGPFVTHPPKPTRVLHSEAYLRYMDGLENGRPIQSKWDRLIAKTNENVPNMVSLSFRVKALLLRIYCRLISILEPSCPLAKFKRPSPVNEIGFDSNERYATPRRHKH